MRNRHSIVVALLVLVAPAAGQTPKDYYRAVLAAAEGGIAVGDAGAAVEWLNRAPPALRGWEWDFLRSRADASAERYSVQGASLWAVAAHPDGRRIATGSGTGQVVVFRRGTDSPILRLAHGAAEVYDLTYSADGRHLLSAGSDRFIRRWDAESGVPIDSFSTGSLRPLEIAINANGTELAAGLSAGGVMRWDLQTGALLSSYRGHVQRPPVPGVTFLPDGRVASASWDQHVRVWQDSATTAKLLGPGYEGGGNYSSWSDIEADPRGRYLAAVGRDGLHVWNTTDWTVRRYADHSTDIPALALSPDGELLATGSSDRTIRLRRAITGQLVAVLRGHSAGVQSLEFSGDGRSLYSSAEDGTVRVWDIARAEGERIPLANAVPYVVRWLDTDLFLVGGSDGVVHLLNATPGAAGTPLLRARGPLVAMEVTPDGWGVLTAANVKAPIVIWDLETRRAAVTLADTALAVHAAALSPDGTGVVTAELGRMVRRWDARTGRELGRMPQPEGSRAIPTALRFSADGSQLLVGWHTGEITVLDPITLEVRSRLATTTGTIQTIIERPGTDTYLATTGSGHVFEWDVGSASPRAIWRAHTDVTYGAVFSPDGRRLVTVAVDATARIWDTSDWGLVATIREFDEVGPYCAAFSPDGKALAICSLDRTLRLIRPGGR